MSKKRGRPPAVSEAVSREEFNLIKAQCEDYRKAMERIEDYKHDVSRIKKLLASTSDPFEVGLYSQDLVRVQQGLKADTEMTAYIRWGLSQLEPKTRNILQQLYIDGVVWHNIQDECGFSLGSGSIQHEKNKGLRLMAIALRKKKSLISEKKEAES